MALAIKLLMVDPQYSYWIKPGDGLLFIHSSLLYKVAHKPLPSHAILCEPLLMLCAPLVLLCYISFFCMLTQQFIMRFWILQLLTLYLIGFNLDCSSHLLFAKIIPLHQ